MTNREKGFLVVLFIVVVIFGFYYFFMQHQLDDLDSYDSQIAANESAIQAHRLAKANLKNVRSQKEDLELSLSEFYRDFLQDIEQEELILLVNEILVRSNVEVDALNFSDFNNILLSALDYDEMTMTVDVNGTYADIINLISSFWRFDHNIYVKGFNLERVGEQESDVEEQTINPDNITGSVTIAFVRVNNEYASDVTLFEWYNDVYYDKEDPFTREDFSYLFDPNYFYTGTDVAFYNEPFEGFNDTAGHWAEEVINFFGRNGYIIGDESGNARPDEPMTRLETVLLLDLVFRWELQDDFVELQSFADYDTIDALSDIEKKALLKGYNSGYLFGYEDNTLRPYNNISYEELGFLGNNLLGSEITWADVASEISENFGYESVGIQTPTAPATRAEIIYFLSYINDRLVD
ncbi:S-layer homology domain-containing protein [Acidaminobacter sp. JC074]|uniref:S-layer homology domain-containing protein n=1 Tax=Acidaminobacter sp. JC074 TaxID=2530199 RepID=UPI001F0E79E2|nr:S-layer homology domain-containing protein [Acidaminobacter sp. JC074]MCH4888554.1 S-layer homology domain-containing protein [Acidaminobacter sp. JC074]